MNRNYISFCDGRDAVAQKRGYDAGAEVPIRSTKTKLSWLMGLLMMAFLLPGIKSFAQVNAYSFAQSSGTFTTLTGAVSGGGAILGVPTGNTISTSQDDFIYTASGFPFSFTFNGTAYTSCSVSTNGFITFGGTAPAVGYYTPITGTTAYNGAIAAWGKDSNSFFSLGGRTGELRWDVVGTSPNREVVIQWKDWHVAYLSSATTSFGQTYQIRLQENGNKVVIAYGPGSFAIGSTAVSGSTTTGAQIGLRGTSTTDFNIRTNASTALFTASTNSATNTTSTTQAFNTTAGTPGMPSNGLLYTFSPPSPCSGTPTAGTIATTAGVCSGSTIVLTASGFTTGVTGISFQWEESNDNVSFASVVGGTGATTASYTSAAISASKYYRCKVTCANGGANATTNSCTVSVVNCTFDVAKTANTYTSIASTGTSMTGTWRNGTLTDDNLSASQPIGFAFNYKGGSYSNFSASTNGFLTFNTATAAIGSGTGAYGYQNTAFTTSGGTGSTLTIAPFYEDLVTPGNPGTAAGLNGAIKYKLDGTAPNRVATIEWIGMETFGNAGPNLNFQVKLYETTGVVEILHGTMELFNGTFNYSYSYTMGLNGSTMGATPTVAELQTQQVTNVQNFSNVASNALTGFQDCNIKYAFTPGNYSVAAATPTITNDESAGAIDLTVNSASCTAFCGTYYKTNGATASAAIGVCTAATAGTPDDDVWFKFVATYANTTITVRSAGGYDAVLQLLNSSLTPISCANATITGLSETLNPTTLTLGATYYIRVYHSGAANGTTPEISICVNGFTPPPANDDVCGALSLTSAATCVTTAGSTLNSTTSVQAVCGGTPDDDVWYKFTALTSTDVVTVQSGAGFNAHLQVFSSSDNSCTGTLTSLGCINNTSTAGIETYTGSGLTAGNTYYVRIYHTTSGTGTGNFTVCVTASAPVCIASPTTPLNAGSSCAGSTVTLSWPAASGATSYDLVLDGGATINQVGTTYAAGVLALGAHTWSVTPKNIVGAPTGCTVWTFNVLATPVAGTATGPATLFTAQVGTYTETSGTGGSLQWSYATVSGGPYTAISGSTTNPASVSFPGPGTFYMVLERTVSGCTVARSNEVTTVVSVRGDLPCDPIALVVGSNGPYSNVGATISAGEVAPPGSGCTVQTGWCNATLNNTIWGTFVAPASGRVTILAPSFDDQLALYSVTDCSNFATYTLIAANDDSGATNGGLTNSAYLAATCLTPGQTYYVQLDGYSTTGTTTIVITDAGNAAPSFAGCPSNISLVNDLGQCTAVATWTAPVATDSDACIAPLVVTSSHAPGFAFPIGVTTVTYTVSDGINPTVTCSFTVTVALTTGNTYYVDADGDGYGSTTTVLGCAGPLAGQSTNNTDCDDTNVAIYQSAPLYSDADGDGYTVGTAVVTCYGATLPLGKKLTSLGADCNDTAGAINPGASEVAYDGLDNNCNGTIDEGFPPIATKLIVASCNSTILNIYSSINAIPVSLASDYRFRITNGASVQIIDRPVPWFFMSLLSSYDYSTTYTVDVMLKVGGVWLGYYGDSCTITSPNIASPSLASIISPACGSSLATIYSTITANSIYGATGYKFRVTNGAEVQEFETVRNFFRMTNLASYVYGTTYTIEVAIKTTGAYSGYGPACTLSTPAVPQIAQCGATLPSGSVVASVSLSSVTLYTYEITTPTGIVVRNKVAPNFQVNSIPGYSPSTPYSVRLAVTSTGVQSPWGAACTINPAPAARFGNSVESSTGLVTEFKAVGAPNPFESNFTLSVTTASDAKVQIAVYDMIGKQLESKEVNATDANEIALGANYPSGVYNVVVSQGANVKSLRMIKR